MKKLATHLIAFPPNINWISKWHVVASSSLPKSITHMPTGSIHIKIANSYTSLVLKPQIISLRMIANNYFLDFWRSIRTCCIYLLCKLLIFFFGKWLSAIRHIFLWKKNPRTMPFTTRRAAPFTKHFQWSRWLYPLRMSWRKKRRLDRQWLAVKCQQWWRRPAAYCSGRHHRWSSAVL